MQGFRLRILGLRGLGFIEPTLNSETQEEHQKENEMEATE